MSKSKSDLSITKRVLLDFVKYRTQRGGLFFASNEYIAKGLDLTESPGCDSLFVLDRNQYSQQDTNGAKAEFKTRKHFPISRLNVVVCTSKQLFHRKNLLCF